jgi:hypothetical protein
LSGGLAAVIVSSRAFSDQFRGPQVSKPVGHLTVYYDDIKQVSLTYVELRGTQTHLTGAASAADAKGNQNDANYYKAVRKY